MADLGTIARYYSQHEPVLRPAYYGAGLSTPVLVRGTLTGRAHNKHSYLPLSRVTLRWTATSAVLAEMLTDSSGRYQFFGLILDGSAEYDIECDGVGAYPTLTTHNAVLAYNIQTPGFWVQRDFVFYTDVTFTGFDTFGGFGSHTISLSSAGVTILLTGFDTSAFGTAVFGTFTIYPLGFSTAIVHAEQRQPGLGGYPDELAPGLHRGGRRVHPERLGDMAEFGEATIS
jgi:hypothetical protein